MKFERLGNIISISKGKKHEPAPKKEQRNFRYIQIEDLRNNNNLKYTDEKGVEVHENDLIIAWDGANAGTIGFGLRGMIGSTLARLRIKEEKEFNTDFLGFFLKKNSSYLRSKATGATIPHIDRATLESLKIPLLDYPEQYEIAKVLSQSENLISQRQESINLIDEFLRSTFLEMFGDPVKNEKGWKKDKIGNRCKVTKLAGYEYTKHINYSDEGEIIVVKGLNVKNGKLKLDNVSFIDSNTSNYLIRSKLFKGDVVMTYIGINIGDVAIIEEDNKYHLAPNVSKITPNDFNDINSHYLLHYLMYNRWLFARGTTDTAKPALNMGEIREIEIIIPSIKLQKKFEAIVNQIDKIKIHYQESLQELENLYGSLSQQAFKGELEFKSTKQPFIGDPFEGVEIPEGKLPSIDDLDKTKWIDVTESRKENVSKVVSNTAKKDSYETLFPLIGKVEGRGGDLRDVELLISKHFKDGYFVFEDLKRAFIDMGFSYDFELLKNFVFELLRKGKIQQVFADASFKTQFTDQHPDFKKVNELKEQMYLQRTTVL